MKQLAKALLIASGVYILYKILKRSDYKSTSQNTLLWQLSGNGLRNPSYILGTMHLMCAEDAVLSKNTLNIIKRVREIYLEADLHGTADFSGLTGGPTLASVLSEEDYRAVKSFFEEAQPNIPFECLEQQPPLMLSSGLYEFLLPCKQTNGIEALIIEEAFKYKKLTKGLETLDFQREILLSIPFQEQAAELVKAIRNLDKYRQSVVELVDMYKRQDVEKLYNLSLHDDSLTGHLDAVLYNRNVDWAARIVTIAKKNSALFAVGAGHLGGSRGLLSLLKQHGYVLRPLDNSFPS